MGDKSNDSGHVSAQQSLMSMQSGDVKQGPRVPPRARITKVTYDKHRDTMSGVAIGDEMATSDLFAKAPHDITPWLRRRGPGERDRTVGNFEQVYFASLSDLGRATSSTFASSGSVSWNCPAPDICPRMGL